VPYHEVWLLPASGPPRRLGDGTGPQWSADGSRIAAYDPYVERLVLYRLRGGRTTRRVVAGTEDAGDWKWSPAGDRLAYEYDPGGCEGRTNELFVLDVRTGARRVIYDSGLCSDDSVAYDWSPDGKRLAFSACRQHVIDAGEFSLSCRLVVENADGSGRPVVLRVPTADLGSAGVGAVAWSPDGRSIAFSAGDDSDRALVVFDLASRKATRFLGGDTRSIAWAPDGRSLAYATDDRVWLLDRRSGRRRSLLRGTGDDFFESLAWSPSREVLAVGVEADASRRQGLLLVDPRNGRVVHRTHGADTAPAWRPAPPRDARPPRT
jgi:Tol biopolymer transport system component